MFQTLHMRQKYVFTVLIIFMIIIFLNRDYFLIYTKSTGGSLSILKKLTWSNNRTPKTNHISAADLPESEKLIRNQKNIFFLETSLFGNNGTILSPRKACAIESAARMNPGFNISLLIFNKIDYLSTDTIKLMVSLISYKNIYFRQVNVDDFVKNTPLEDWWNADIIKRSKWPESHMSDILRYLTLWKYTGIYLDLDFVIMKSLEHLKNFAAAETSSSIASGALGFSSDKLGEKLLDDCLDELKNNFNGNIWNHNGPRVITEILKKLCNTPKTEEMTVDKCQGFEVLPPSTFYPIHWDYWEKYFTSENFDESMEKINKSLAIHVFSHASKIKKVEVGSQVPYGVIANKYCPEVYHKCGKTF